MEYQTDEFLGTSWDACSTARHQLTQIFIFYVPSLGGDSGGSMANVFKHCYSEWFADSRRDYHVENGVDFPLRTSGTHLAKPVCQSRLFDPLLNLFPKGRHICSINANSMFSRRSGFVVSRHRLKRLFFPGITCPAMPMRSFEEAIRGGSSNQGKSLCTRRTICVTASCTRG
jgi:hypothetical protein